LTLDQAVEKILAGIKNISIMQFHPTVPYPGELPRAFNTEYIILISEEIGNYT